jgi:hypothetical protein
LLLLCVGCSAQGDSSSSSPADAPSESSVETTSSASEISEDAIPEETIDACNEIIYTYFNEMLLYSNWEDAPVPADDPPNASNFTLKVRRDGDLLTVTVDLYGSLHIDPVTLDEDTWGGARIVNDTTVETVRISAPDSLTFATSIVRLQETAGGLSPVSCEYKPLEHPGLDYLKAQTELLQPELSASEKIDVANYDTALVNYIWRLAYSKRYIEMPDDLTLYDLANITGGIELLHTTIGADMEDPEYRLDASLLKLVPNLDSVWCLYRLADYSVFGNMNNLSQLRMQWPGDELFSTLRVGHADRLWLDDPDTGNLDMTNVNTGALVLNSWSTAVGGFTG